MTGDPRRWPNDSATSGTVHFWGPFLYRSVFYAETQEQECARALEHLERTISFEGPKTIAAVVLESIPGTAGVMVPPEVGGRRLTTGGRRRSRPAPARSHRRAPAPSHRRL
jgi:adenosylmethionine-8-amino-7-oxononanoate aminotransferase